MKSLAQLMVEKLSEGSMGLKKLGRMAPKKKDGDKVWTRKALNYTKKSKQVAAKRAVSRGLGHADNPSDDQKYFSAKGKKERQEVKNKRTKSNLIASRYKKEVEKGSRKLPKYRPGAVKTLPYMKEKK